MIQPLRTTPREASDQVFLGQKEKDHTLVSVPGDVRRKHMAIFGKSGVGKTTLMRNMLLGHYDARSTRVTAVFAPDTPASERGGPPFASVSLEVQPANAQGG